MDPARQTLDVQHERILLAATRRGTVAHALGWIAEGHALDDAVPLHAVVEAVLAAEHAGANARDAVVAISHVARDALRAGRLYRPIGRRYADPAGFLMPAERWRTDRHELAVTFGRTLNGEERLSQLRAEQQHALRNLQAAIDASDGVRLVASRLELSPPEALDESPRRCGCARSSIDSRRGSTSPICSPRSSNGPASPATSRTPPARPRAWPTCSSTCTPRCSRPD